MHKSGYYAVEFSNLYILDVALNTKENHRGINHPYTCHYLYQMFSRGLRLLHVTWPTILLLVLKLLEGQPTAKQVSCIDHLNLNQTKLKKKNYGHYITKIRLFKYTKKLHLQKLRIFRKKKIPIFFIFLLKT